MTDLSRSQFPTEFFTIKVSNFKDSYAESASLHGLFTDKAEAEQIARTLGLAYDFLRAEAVPIQFGTVEQVAQAQGIGWLPEGYVTPAQVAEAARIAVESDIVLEMTTIVHSDDDEVEVPVHRVGSYLNPTPESLRAEAEGEQALREQMRAEAESDEGEGGQ